jgi:hypothetical protein
LSVGDIFFSEKINAVTNLVVRNERSEFRPQSNRFLGKFQLIRDPSTWCDHGDARTFAGSVERLVLGTVPRSDKYRVGTWQTSDIAFVIQEESLDH